MIKITKKVEYSLMVLRYLNKSESLVSVNELSENLLVPFDTTSHVLQTLTKAKITESIQGQSGGYKLIGNLKALSFYELSELIEKKKFYKNCDELDCSKNLNCNIKGPITNLNKKIQSFFQNLSILDLLEAKL